VYENMRYVRYTGSLKFRHVYNTLPQDPALQALSEAVGEWCWMTKSTRALIAARRDRIAKGLEKKLYTPKQMRIAAARLFLHDHNIEIDPDRSDDDVLAIMQRLGHFDTRRLAA